MKKKRFISQQRIGVIAAILMATAIGLAAIGSHIFDFHAESERSSFDTAIYLLLANAAALLAMSARSSSSSNRIIEWSQIGIVVGSVLFSGSVISNLAGLSAFASLAPVGGLLMIFSWLATAAGIARTSKRRRAKRRRPQREV